MGDPSTQYLLIQSDGTKIGFAILCGMGSVDCNIELKRIAMVQPGAGQGQPALHALIDYAFNQMGANRLWLDVLDDNARAQHIYRKMGFREEGRMRQAMWLNGTFRDLILFSMLASEYGAH